MDDQNNQNDQVNDNAQPDNGMDQSNMGQQQADAQQNQDTQPEDFQDGDSQATPIMVSIPEPVTESAPLPDMNMAEAAVEQAEESAQTDPNLQHVIEELNNLPAEEAAGQGETPEAPVNTEEAPAPEWQTQDAAQNDQAVSSDGVVQSEEQPHQEAIEQTGEVPVSAPVLAEEPISYEAVQQEPVSEGEPMPAEPTVEASSEPVPAENEQPAVEESQPESPEVAAEPDQSRTPVAAPMINDIIMPTQIAQSPETVVSVPEAAPAAEQQSGVIKKKSKTPVLILITVLVVLLFGGAAVAAYLMQPKTVEKAVSMEVTETMDKADSEEQAKDVTPKTLADYASVCESGSHVSTTQAAGAVRPLALFEQSADGSYAQSSIVFKDSTLAADSAAVTKTQLVGCLSAVEASDVKIKTCSLVDASKVTVSVDYYSRTYSLAVYNAKDGTLEGTKEVKSTSTDCPATATYDKTSPKIYAPVDATALEAAVKVLATQAATTTTN